MQEAVRPHIPALKVE
ncbi:hypothetical protein ACVBEF_10850 [Glaciimonas sp. GG7]